MQTKLNRGLDFINLDDILVDLKLGPEVLEVGSWGHVDTGGM